MRHIKSLVVTTFIVLIIAAGLIHYIGKKELPPAITLDTTGQPTIGYPKAKVHVVVFEEPKCSNCRDYSREIYPSIKKNFIDTNKITYTVIPVSFLPRLHAGCCRTPLCLSGRVRLSEQRDVF